VNLAGDPDLEHDEFVAAEPSHNVLDANDRTQTFGNRFKQRIAAVVPKGVVNALEAVKIEEVHGNAVTPQGKNGKRCLQTLDELGAICQAGQRVMVREESDATVRLLLLLGSPIPGERRKSEQQCGTGTE
jgi:hypothetical protein